MILYAALRRSLDVDYLPIFLHGLIQRAVLGEDIMKVAVTCVLSLLCAAPCLAQDFVYTPTNPSFGGNPLNSGHLLGTASAQRNATAFDFEDPVAPGSTAAGSLSQTDLFVAQLESRLLSALSSQVVEAIFGENPQDSGSVVFGTTTISFDRGADEIALTIVDVLDGSVTEISIPTLVPQ